MSPQHHGIAAAYDMRSIAAAFDQVLTAAVNQA